ncbi:DUF2536 family protein [Bacillus weihaiensis]|uniref:DUF2536 domain-containing protein n=1 Tax=Bacillus weihaiensis TaxID=1547283 RepID=A0A1L3MPM8_9BACI|nr:DUF2536 family protein [Bacillus weihaiensis]APH04300.1 hypothetical protein A9C19_05830 [Bacillus weihaiensis]
MNLQLDLIKDKVEFFEAINVKELEKKINEQIVNNQALLLSVHSVSHNVHSTPDGRTIYTAVVHFKAL